MKKAKLKHTNFSGIHRVGDGRAPRLVYLNGNQIDACYVANIPRGFVIVPDKDEFGRVMFDRKTGEIKCRKIHGKVTVKFMYKR